MAIIISLCHKLVSYLFAVLKCLENYYAQEDEIVQLQLEHSLIVYMKILAIRCCFRKWRYLTYQQIIVKNCYFQEGGIIEANKAFLLPLLKIYHNFKVKKDEILQAVDIVFLCLYILLCRFISKNFTAMPFETSRLLILHPRHFVLLTMQFLTEIIILLLL